MALLVPPNFNPDAIFSRALHAPQRPYKSSQKIATKNQPLIMSDSGQVEARVFLSRGSRVSEPRVAFSALCRTRPVGAVRRCYRRGQSGIFLFQGNGNPPAPRSASQRGITRHCFLPQSDASVSVGREEICKCNELAAGAAARRPAAAAHLPVGLAGTL